MGRLTLNVLLSFAQFEREVIGERVRDKIAASKSKGIWVGGPVALGYRSVAEKLEVVPEDAALVRKLFADYLRLGSIGELAASLDRDGIRPRPRKLANGRVIAAARFMVGPLAHILKNRFYYILAKSSIAAKSTGASTRRSSIESYSKPSRQDLPSGPFRESSPEPGRRRSSRV